MKIETGSKVAYNVQFLKSIGMTHTDLDHARGIVTNIKDLGSLKIAEIDWKDEDIPTKVNVKNLAIVGPNSKFCNVG